MTHIAKHEQPYTVLIHPDVADAIDFSLSPVDGAIAVGQLREDLPRFHRTARMRFWHRLIPRYTRLYRGVVAGDVAFSYVQIDRTLHVLAVWCSPPAHHREDRIDVKLPEPVSDEDMLDEVKHGVGISDLTNGDVLADM